MCHDLPEETQPRTFDARVYWRPSRSSRLEQMTDVFSWRRAERFLPTTVILLQIDMIWIASKTPQIVFALHTMSPVTFRADKGLPPRVCRKSERMPARKLLPYLQVVYYSGGRNCAKSLTQHSGLRGISWWRFNVVKLYQYEIFLAQLVTVWAKHAQLTKRL